MSPPKRRVRRGVEDARQRILETAEAHLAADGPAGVKVQRIARELGITDAGVNHHFGSREALLEALLRFCGRRFVEELRAEVAARGEAPFDAGQAARLLLDFYGRRGTGRLAMWLMLSGWEPQGSGMLEPLVDWAWRSALLATRRDCQKLVAVLSAVTLSQALSRDAILRSVGLDGVDEADFLDWVARLAASPRP
ncbi:AcrR family transcriptional regulator [Caulobacter ginsengisoli]|uniref:AcrR family transcriptional regulator n=1 Tax=Caulobacter ginsengisoli TaxID=400775 RepID=A0ABU0ISC2_9CAUL|nr:helix-turn-helix domain-containing protein [Caulobacter ginsengisoli]MDQ0464053.1 AcrR family transcriptional regulator [Caulobacter ginsengisoli]